MMKKQTPRDLQSKEQKRRRNCAKPSKNCADVEGPSIAAGWAILSKSAARALDFDARLTERLAPESTRNSDKHSKRYDGNIGGHKPERRGTQNRLSTGTGRRMQFASTLQHHSRCSVSEVHGSVPGRQCLSTPDAMGRPLLHEPDSEEAERARINLQHVGVTVDSDGKMELSNAAKHIMKQAPWILKDEEEESKPAEQTHGPAQRTLSRIMRNIAKIEAAERWTHSNEKEKETGTGGREAQELVEL